MSAGAALAGVAALSAGAEPAGAAAAGAGAEPAGAAPDGVGADPGAGVRPESPQASPHRQSATAMAIRTDTPIPHTDTAMPGPTRMAACTPMDTATRPAAAAPADTF